MVIIWLAPEKLASPKYFQPINNHLQLTEQNGLPLSSRINTFLSLSESFHDEKSIGTRALQLPVIHPDRLHRDHLSKLVPNTLENLSK